MNVRVTGRLVQLNAVPSEDQVLVLLIALPEVDQLLLLHSRGVIYMGHIDISITLIKQYSLLSLVNTYRNVSKYQKHENGHLEKKLRAEYRWCR